MVEQQNKSRSSRVTPTPTPTPTPTNSSNLVREEKHLKNGDIYVGTLLGKVPHGVGKYLWCDGCMYEGEWKKGEADGKGMLSWPSGDTYEGQFKSGLMEGFGTLTCVDGHTYKGAWLACNKHGYGEKWFSNGDYYSGGWKRNLQEGYGKYIWRNGDHYQGEWRNGVISSKGCLVRTNGGRFDGVWDNGVGKTTPCDNSVLSYEPKFASPNLKKTNGGVLPRMCVWESESEAEDITCSINDNEESAPMFYREKQLTSPCSLIDEVKQPGQASSKGHKNYDLMVNLQHGIRYSIGKYGLESRKLKSKDFNPMEKFWTKFPSEGSKLTPTHKSTDFRWKDYCPWVFRDLRDLFQVDPAEYVSAICENDALRELSSPGKSGCFFYLTQDDKFLIKTVKKSELKVLLRMLPSYYQHVCRYENSLVTKFYGLHCVKPAGGPKTRFIVMGNLFCSEYRIHKRFDLKGSRHGRTIEKAEGEIDETTTLKDLDLDFVFRLPKNCCRELIKQVERDCEFLEAERIMDYSLLIGIHFRNNDKVEKIELSPIIPHGEKAPDKNEKYLLGHHSLEADLQNMDRVLAGRKSRIRFGSNMPARAERLARGSDLDRYIPGGNDNVTTSHNNEIFEVILYSGIIDILQDYDMSKWLEHAYKSLQVDPTSISAVDPKLYSKRFRDFIKRIFVED